MVPQKSPQTQTHQSIASVLLHAIKCFRQQLGWSTQFKIRSIYPLFLSASHFLVPPFQVLHYPSRHPASLWHPLSAKVPICLASCFQISSPRIGLWATVPPGHTGLPFTRTNFTQDFLGPWLVFIFWGLSCITRMEVPVGTLKHQLAPQMAKGHPWPSSCMGFAWVLVKKAEPTEDFRDHNLHFFTRPPDSRFMDTWEGKRNHLLPSLRLWLGLGIKLT